MRKFLFATALTFVLITTQSCGNKAEQSKSQEAKVVEIPGTTIKLKINDDNFDNRYSSENSKTTINRKDTLILQIPNYEYKSTQGYVNEVNISYSELNDTTDEEDISSINCKALKNEDFISTDEKSSFSTYTIIASELPTTDKNGRTITHFLISAYINTLGIEDNKYINPYKFHSHWLYINEESNTIK